MRIDAVVWLLGGVLALAGGAAAGEWGKAVARQTGKNRSGLYLAGVALACVVAGLAWRAAQAGTWTNGTPTEGLALLAGGALGCLLWAGSRRQATLTGGLIAAGAVLLAAAVLGWNAPAASPSPQARTWLFGLRSVLAGLGLGGWPVIGAAVLEVAGRDANAWRKDRSRRATGRPAAEESGEATANGDLAAAPSNPDPAASGGGTPLPAVSREAPVPLPASANGAAAPLPASPQEAPVLGPPAATAETVSATGGALAALRFSYPWLTAAIVAAGLWNAVAFATPWRSQPGDLWLAVTWLIGAACLHLASRREDSLRPHGSRIYLVLLGALALCGLAAALLAALQAPSVLS